MGGGRRGLSGVYQLRWIGALGGPAAQARRACTRSFRLLLAGQRSSTLGLQLPQAN